MAMTLIAEAVHDGARQSKACAVLGLTCRTLRRWRAADSLVDRRKGAPRKPCRHALTADDKQDILAACNSPESQSLPPSQIVPRLADKGLYLASESSFYRVLREHGQANRRGHAQPPRTVPKPHAWLASAPLKTWSWDITFLPTAVRGQFYRLYMVMDVYSRLIVGWEIHEDERAEHAATLITKACLRHRERQDALVLHADNGSPRDLVQLRAPSQRHQISDPAQRHYGQEHVILERRRRVYEAAKQSMPARWKGRHTRDWSPVGDVWLNPSKESAGDDQKLNRAA